MFPQIKVQNAGTTTSITLKRHSSNKTNKKYSKKKFRFVFCKHFPTFSASTQKPPTRLSYQSYDQTIVLFVMASSPSSRSFNPCLTHTHTLTTLPAHIAALESSLPLKKLSAAVPLPAFRLVRRALMYYESLLNRAQPPAVPRVLVAADRSTLTQSSQQTRRSAPLHASCVTGPWQCRIIPHS